MNRDSLIIHNISSDDMPLSAAMVSGFLNFGSSLSDQLDPELDMPECIYSDLIRLLAEEVLLSRVLKIDVPARVYEGVSNLRIFGDDYPTVEQLSNLKGSVAVFPVGSIDNRPPAVGHIWVFQNENGIADKDHRNQLMGSRNIIPAETSLAVYFSSSDKNSTIEYESWQLAFEMARKGIDNLYFKKECALNWIFTGKVRDSKVAQIGIARKNELELNTERTFVIPRSNHKSGLFQKDVKSVSTLNEAFAWVSREGIRRIGTVKWPERVYELHSFTSKTISPVITAAILCQPQKVVLWHSGNETESEKPAWNVYRILSELLIDTVIEEPKLISSTSLDEVEQTLSTYFSNSSENGTIIFNITQGNRLMALGPHYLARRNPDIWLIYRDIDLEDNLGYVGINYEKSSTSPSTMILNSSRRPEKVRWDRIVPEFMDDEHSWRNALLCLLSRKSSGVRNCSDWRMLLEENTDR